ncbi:MAG: hypothetical protein Q7R34_09970 [Dehalococcoidia bacterium]|nr:hypothetical protein [Dehalococcoidia bacterium]
MGAKTLTFFIIMLYNVGQYWLAVQPVFAFLINGKYRGKRITYEPSGYHNAGDVRRLVTGEDYRWS